MDQVLGHVRAFFSNPLLMSAITAWLVAQLIKIVIALLRRERCNYFHLLFSNGGMPSSHSSCVTALAVASGIKYGLGSPWFAVTAILAAIVMTDASGVRYETGKQAQLINKIVKELFSGTAEGWNTGLKELVGHTPFQVFVGVLVGFPIGIGMCVLLG